MRLPWKSTVFTSRLVEEMPWNVVHFTGRWLQQGLMVSLAVFSLSIKHFKMSPHFFDWRSLWSRNNKDGSAGKKVNHFHAARYYGRLQLNLGKRGYIFAVIKFAAPLVLGECRTLLGFSDEELAVPVRKLVGVKHNNNTLLWLRLLLQLCCLTQIFNIWCICFSICAPLSI